MKKISFILLASLLLCSCTNTKSTTRILSENGYTNIKTTGYSWMSCSRGDFYSTGFKAVSPAGVMVSGAVCEGFILKNATIRFN
jgi:hypothetical protein